MLHVFKSGRRFFYNCSPAQRMAIRAGVVSLGCVAVYHIPRRGMIMTPVQAADVKEVVWMRESF